MPRWVSPRIGRGTGELGPAPPGPVRSPPAVRTRPGATIVPRRARSRAEYGPADFGVGAGEQAKERSRGHRHWYRPPGGSGLLGAGPPGGPFRPPLVRERGRGRLGPLPLGVSPDGVWEFAYAKNPAPAVDGFQDPDYDVSQWGGIPVPAHIQFRGYDLPQYVNVQHPWDGHEQIDPGRVPQDYNPVGLLRARLHPARTPARRRADRVQGQPPRVRRPGRVM